MRFEIYFRKSFYAVNDYVALSKVAVFPKTHDDHPILAFKWAVTGVVHYKDTSTAKVTTIQTGSVDEYQVVQIAILSNNSRSLWAVSSTESY